AAPHEAGAVAKVLREDREPAGASGVAAFFFELRDAAEVAESGAAGGLGRKSGGAAALDLAVEVVAEFLVELAVGLGRVEEGAEAGAELKQESHVSLPGGQGRCR